MPGVMSVGLTLTVSFAEPGLMETVAVGVALDEDVGRAVGEGAGLVPTRIDALRTSSGCTPLLAFNVKENRPMAVGVPEIRPRLGEGLVNFRPGGSCPDSRVIVAAGRALI